MPKRHRLNRARERRIVNEIVVDAYTPDERAMSWYYYLEGKLAFPFRAKCLAIIVPLSPALSRAGRGSLSPMKKGEEVEVLSLAKEDDCMTEMFVVIRFGRRKFGGRLSQLEPLTAERKAMEDWRYY